MRGICWIWNGRSRLRHSLVISPPEPNISDKPKSARLPGLEALRCVAAFCVLALHTRAVFGGEPVFGRGYLGVDFFLMLSGFLMARVQEPRLAGGMKPLPFMVKRYRRLWPMMAAGGIIGIPMQMFRATGVGQFIVTFLLNMALLPVFGQPFIFPLNIPAWTIFMEVAANAAHVFVLHRLRKWGLLAAIAVLIAVMCWAGMHYHSFDVGAKPSTLLAGVARIFLAYVIGMALSRWWGDTPTIGRWDLRIWPVVALVLMPAVLILGWWFRVKGWWFDLAFVLLICPLMIAGGLRLRRFQRSAALIGQLSFPLFALQMPVLQGLKQLGFTYWTGFFAASLAGVSGAVMAHYLTRWRAARSN
jgi:peptidoglycan/LPS O-acetylase OafA/YrhL